MGTLSSMKKLSVLAAAAALLALAGCAASAPSPATFSDPDVKEILFGEAAQASLGELGFTAERNTLATAPVATYLANVASGDVIDPERCAESARPLLLSGRDADSTDPFYELPTLIAGSSVVTVQARLFADDATAAAFLDDFHAAVAACPQFTDTQASDAQGADTVGVAVAVSDPDPDGRGFFIDTVAGTPEAARSFRTYIVRQGNLAFAVRGAATTDADDALLVGTSSALYARATEVGAP